MQVNDLLQAIGDRLQSAATVKTVFGEPVTAAGRTIIPVARVRFGFGAGGGNRGGEADQPAGGGGGGGVHAEPAGFLEITDAGTFYTSISDHRRLAGALLIGLVSGLIIARRK